jgi:hypothetical protein
MTKHHTHNQAQGHEPHQAPQASEPPPEKAAKDREVDRANEDAKRRQDQEVEKAAQQARDRGTTTYTDGTGHRQPLTLPKDEEDGRVHDPDLRSGRALPNQP